MQIVSLLSHVLQGSTAVTQVNLRLALSVQFHTRWHYIAIYGSICLWLAFVCAYNALPLGTLGSIAHQVVPPPAKAVHIICLFACGIRASVRHTVSATWLGAQLILVTYDPD